MYRDCSSPNAVPFSNYIIPGVYQRTTDTLKKDYYNSSGDSMDQEIWKIDEFQVTPPAAAKSCTFAPTTCIREGIYEGVIGLPASSFGYYLYFETCCRNTMVNAPGISLGQGYFAIIPPTSVANTTPQFNAVPSPYICVNDTVSLLYSASEPDGDSLVYTLSTPYGGGSSGGSGAVAPANWPRDAYPYTLATISYSSGYSSAKPFGSSGYVSLDKITGILTMYAKTIGRYALAVDVHEYRNGKQISVTRRDVQIIVISCPYRQAPVRVAISDSLSIDNGTPTTYYIQAGQRLAFNLRYSADNTGVSVFSETGFFDKPNTLIHQPVFNYSFNGNNVTAYFNWQTTCRDASNSPYTFTLTIADTGCPPKTTYQGIKIYVSPFAGVKNIYGPIPACQNVVPSIYSANNAPTGDTLFWHVKGGTYKNGPNDSSISVNWGNSTSGTIEAVMHNKYGCGNDTLSKRIIINPKPSLPTISGSKNPCAGFTTLYSANSHSGLTFYWKVYGGTITSMSNQSRSISVKWLKADNYAYITMYEQDSNGCYSDTAIMNVIVSQALADSIYGSVSVCPNAQGIDYWVNPQPGAEYYWTIIGGMQVAGANGPQITVNWGNKGGGLVMLNEITSQGCIGDTITLKVLKDYFLYTSAIKGDSSTCEYEMNVPYSVTKNTGSNYAWQISGGSINSGNGTSRILVNWDSIGPGALLVTETAYDSINHKPCKGIPVSLNIYKHATPGISPIIGPAILCENDSGFYSVSGDSGSTYIWKINGQNIQNTTTRLKVIDTGMKKQVDTLHISVIEKSFYGCGSKEQDTSVIVYKVPSKTAISGPASVCLPDLNNIVYKVNGLSNSTYKWAVNGGVIISGNTTNQIAVNWNQAGYGTISVQEINQIGCLGPLLTLTVKVDSFEINMQLVTTRQSDDKIIDLYWHPLNTLFFSGYYKIYRQREGESYFSLIDSLSESYYSYADKNVNTAQYAYRYQIKAENSCGVPTVSNIHRSIRLGAVFDNDSTIHLNWTPYQGWPVSGYDINMGLNTDTALSFYGLSLDTLYTAYKTLEGYRQCLRILAKDSGMKNITSFSNKVCIEYEPLVWIPDIFTPNNGDNLNNTFHIFVENYSSFSIDIYNRWGEHIFSSTDPSKQWNGTYKGIDCIEGVYLYMITVNGAKENIYRSGTVELER